MFLKHVYQYPSLLAKSAGLRNVVIYCARARMDIEFVKPPSPDNSIAKGGEISDKWNRVNDGPNVN